MCSWDKPSVLIRRALVIRCYHDQVVHLLNLPMRNFSGVLPVSFLRGERGFGSLPNPKATMLPFPFFVFLFLHKALERRRLGLN